MNLGLRAILYTVRKWKKTLLVFFLLLAITTLVLSGLAIADAQEEQAEEVRGTTGASFTVERNLSTGGWASGNSGSYSTQEFISEEMLQEISSVGGVVGYDAAVVSMPSYYDEAGETFVNGNVINSYYTYGSINTEYNQLFSSGSFELVEGSHITENVKNGLIISKENAERNGIKIGDKITGINDPNNGDPEVDMEIVGFFDVVADKDDEATMYDASTLWDYTDYAFCSYNAMKEMAVNYEDGSKLQEAHFFVEDAAQLDNVIAKVQNISSINWDNFIITANDEVYQNISSALSDTSTLIITLIVVITTVSMVLIIHNSHSLHVHPQPKKRNRHLAGGGYRQACGHSPICAGNPADCGGSLPAGIPLQQAGCRHSGNIVWQDGRECHRHAAALYAGSHCGRHTACGGGAGIQYFSHAVKAQADFAADGIKEGLMI